MLSLLLTITALATQTTAQTLYDLAPATPSSGPLNKIPLLGLGTWALRDNSTEVIAQAITTGYRHIDTATIYGNQASIAPGIRLGLQRSNLTRKDLFITTKLWDDHHADPEKGLREGLQQLGLEYVDLWLMHYPIGTYVEGGKTTHRFDFLETWRKMEGLVGEPEQGGLARFIGVSNFDPKQMEELMEKARIKPKAHQFELHPYLQQQSFVDWHHKSNISVIAYAPLANTNPDYKWGYLFDQASAPPQILTSNPIITRIAQDRTCTPAQVVLAWNIRRGVAVIPKTAHAERLAENLGAAAVSVGGRGLKEGGLGLRSCMERLEEGDMRDIEGFKGRGWVRRFNNPCVRMAGLKCFREGLESPDTGI